MTRRRVAITGVGLLGAHGNDPNATFYALCRGESAIREVSVASPKGAIATFAAAQVAPDPPGTAGCSNTGLMDPVSRFALSAAGRAIDDASLNLDEHDP